MTALRQIKKALITVYHKEGLHDVLHQLHSAGVCLISTGGTREFIESLEIPCESVEKYTNFPAILGGRVKTLHPEIFGGILARSESEDDEFQLSRYGIDRIDLVIVDLYPLAETIASGASHDEIIEKIDIGGVSLIRAAAKNFRDVLVVASQSMYSPLLHILKEKGPETTVEERRWFAREAFAVTSGYDTVAFRWFDEGEESLFRAAGDSPMQLRYGENPHQRGRFFGRFEDMFDKIHGKELSYNNLLDIDAATLLIDEFQETTFAVLKHNNPCGVASRPSVSEAWRAALACDPVSAYGGILVTNVPVDRETAAEIDKIFFEVIIAPDYDTDALELLMHRKNRIILIRKPCPVPTVQYRSLLNGVLLQDKDAAHISADDMQPMTDSAPTASEAEDLAFAALVVKHSKSNAIVLARDRQMCASGVGQTSRVDALKQAVEKAERFGFDLKGAVMASDAFFPFADCVEIAGKAGIRAVIQPGGSVNDKQSVDYCNTHGIAMVKTGIRHFKH